jgi:DNA-binding NarL/FixJ family response regulator
MRRHLTLLLTEADPTGFVGEAADGLEAIAMIRTLNPDVVILDICMPRFSGIEVLESLRASGNQAVVIMLTSFATPQHQKRCLEAGANYFFDKSSDFDRLGDVLTNLKRT